jgi:hypothetical protein
MPSKRKPDDPFYVPPVVFLTEEERMEKLRSMPGVVIHERDPNWDGWSAEPWVRVRPGIDPHKLAEQEDDVEVEAIEE